MKVRAIKAHRQEPVVMEGAKGARIRILIGPDDGATTFHMRHFEVELGGCTPHHKRLRARGPDPQGRRDRQERGRRPAVQGGDVIFVPPNEEHQFCNTGSENCEFICLIPPKSCGCG